MFTIRTGNRQILKVHTVSVSNSDSKRIIQYDYLISTIPIIELGKISGLANEIPLKHSKVTI